VAALPLERVVEARSIEHATLREHRDGRSERLQRACGVIPE
jgi:hypothetical protein